jgi:photosynthetic reaction center H subunit
MKPHSIRIVTKRENPRAVAPGLLTHLKDLDDDYMIADPVPDFRDWKVTLPDGRRVGKVDDLIIDTSTMKAKYVEVKVDPGVLPGAEDDRWVLVPIESVRIDEDETRIVIDHLPAGGLADAPRHNGRMPTPDQQRAILAYFEIIPVGAPNG